MCNLIKLHNIFSYVSCHEKLLVSVQCFQNIVSFKDKTIDVHLTIDSSNFCSCSNDPEKSKWYELILFCEKNCSLKNSSIYRFDFWKCVVSKWFVFYNSVNRGDHCKAFTYVMCFIAEFPLNENFKGLYRLRKYDAILGILRKFKNTKGK